MGSAKTSGRVPRMDPYSRLLHRFYEPLILSRVLGQTRGTHTSTPQDGEGQSRRRRRLLRNLAYLCDHDKGGDETSSVALEDNDQCHVFWVASNTPRAGKKNVEFLKSSLATIRVIIALEEEQRGPLEVEFTRTCIEFAGHRVKKEVKLLSRAIRDCQKRTDYVADSELATWLEQFILGTAESTTDICFKAYDQRKAPEMRSLENITSSNNQDASFDKYVSPFGVVHHWLGRLAHHVRAPKEVIEDSLELDHLFDPHEVCLVRSPPSNPRPQADSLTGLDGILKRMLPAEDPELNDYTEALASLDRKFQITKRVRDEYDNKNFQPRIHAEIQILEHFYKNQLRYVGNDSYIGCSKPACYCCNLYFRHHKARPVEPESHQKIYLNWGVPELTHGSKDPGYNAQRDLMNKMLETIRKDALAQIIQKAGPLKWHPDSLTGITISTRALPPIVMSEGISVAKSQPSQPSQPRTIEESSSPSLDDDD
ncbi:uncharacterized protein F4812DRAFT_301628 [Daldinia caldariorum]|uniref:uncharacterized protein n=1 Tax=Daldinia caldariorum TaxID=326644 RepID=UPI002008B3F9|nr:uncharacterized protein F4812DRAFT_301628 [Daldinia caldariorum]KAI1469741.1 hypothetical protein F4812DRAFT_301628 [Daldinia caldariorum]